MTARLIITARVLPDGFPITVTGRNAWMLRRLIDAGAKGLTSIEAPAPRNSHYIFKLRGFGFLIETVDEKHGGPFPGSHARYVLRSEVEVLSDSGRAAA